MTDTPTEVKELQLKIWLSKPPMERLRQFLLDNDTMFRFWKDAKAKIDKRSSAASSKLNGELVTLSIKQFQSTTRIKSD